MSRTAPYASPDYAAAFGAPHRPFHVPEWETSLLLRPIAGSSHQDAAGCYPRTVIGPGAPLLEGFHRLRREGAVSVVLALDPMISPPASALLAAFDVARPFKRHFIFDRDRSGDFGFARHHRYEIRRARQRCRVAEVSLARHLAEWNALYRGLIERHGITGVQSFSEHYFSSLARLPGLVSYAATVNDRIIAMSLWLRHREHAWSHLSAADSEGYRCGASYLLYATAIEELRECRLLDLGGTAGNEDDADSGLARFKRGFANATAQSWLCGRVLDADAYAQLSRGLPESAFFPTYRQPGAGAGPDGAPRFTRQPAPADRSDSAR